MLTQCSSTVCNFVTTIVLVVFVGSAYGQTSIVEPVTFHGCDISLTKITDPKRMSQPVSMFMHELISHVTSEMTSERLAKWLKVYHVNLNVNTTYERNKKIKSEDILYPSYTNDGLIETDSLQRIIDIMKIDEQSGTGIIVFYEYLSKERKSVSGYVVFFDHNSRKIISVITHEYYDRNGYGNFRDYWVPAKGLIRFGCEKFARETSR